MLGTMLMLPVFALRSMVPNYWHSLDLGLDCLLWPFSTGISILVRFVFLLAFLRITYGKYLLYLLYIKYISQLN